jgi:hypothetical protein
MEIPRAWEEYDTLSRWPLIHLRDQFFILLHRPHIREGRRWVPVIDVTRYADDLMLNQGQIEHGGVVWGPGEAVAEVGSEGNYARVYMKDGSTVQIRIRELAVDMRILTEKEYLDEQDPFTESGYGEGVYDVE